MQQTTHARKVFPASAGVILLANAELIKFAGFPRIRGGDPDLTISIMIVGRFSPHPRG